MTDATRRKGNDNISKRVQCNRYRPEHQELKRHVTNGGINELGYESKKESSCFWVQGFNNDTLTKSSPSPDWWSNSASTQNTLRILSGGLKCADANPDEIGSTNKLQSCEKLSTGQNNRGYAKASRKDVSHSPKARAET